MGACTKGGGGCISCRGFCFFWVSAPLCPVASIRQHVGPKWGGAAGRPLRNQGQFQSWVVIFQMNVSTQTWLLFLEPLITAAGGNPTAWTWTQRCLRNGYFRLWLIIIGRKLGGILIEAQNREGTGS